MCYIAGWGTKKVKGPATRILHEAALPLVSHEQCNGPKSYSGVIGGNLICAVTSNTFDSILRKVCLLELLRTALKRKKFHLA